MALSAGGRLVWPLAWAVTLGTLPGVILGGFIRLTWLPDPGPFQALPAACA